MQSKQEQSDPADAPDQSGSRFKSMMRDTWWAWIILCGGGMIAGILVSRIFYIAIPISVFAFFYFGVMRYDEFGNPTGD